MTDGQTPQAPNLEAQRRFEIWMKSAWDAKLEWHKMNNELMNQGSIFLRWIGGLAILAIFYGIVNYHHIRWSLTPKHPIFWAFLSLLLCSICAGLCMYLVLEIRQHTMGMMMEDQNALIRYWNKFVQGNFAVELQWSTDSTYERLRRVVWPVGRLAMIFFFAALVFGAVGLLVSGL